MRWINLFHVSAQLVLFGSLMLLFTRCEVAKVDTIPSALSLMKGVWLYDPVVQTAPDTVKTITVGNIYDIRLYNTHLDKPSPKLVRPTSMIKYDLSYVEEIYSTELSKHTFRWKSTGLKNVMVCIFKNVISVEPKTNEIRNKEDLVWLWTPPQGITDPGSTTFSEGQLSSWNKETLRYELSTSENSLPNKYYIWCILAWDKQGINIVAASRELPLRVYTLK